MSATEFEEWQLYHYKIEPFGEFREDLRWGRAFAPIINILRAATQKNPEMMKPSDFVLDLLEKPKTQSMEEMQEVCKALAKAWKDKPKRKPPATPPLPSPKDAPLRKPQRMVKTTRR